LAYFTFTEAISVADLFAVRALLEGHAVEAAAIRCAGEESAHLVKLAEESAQLVRGAAVTDLSKLSDLDMEFHLQIVVLSANLVLEQLMHRMMQILESVRSRSVVVPGQVERSWKQHVAIAHAIHDGDARLAAARLVEHMESVKTALYGSDGR